MLTLIVPKISGQMPNFGTSETGCQMWSAASYPGHSCAVHIVRSVTSL